jgi:transcription antitermination factor NusG
MSWRALSVFSGNELDVALRMNAAGVEAYCPSFTSITRQRNAHRCMTVTKTRPLFRGYLFARIDDGFRAEPFERSTCKIVVYRRRPLSDAQIDAVRTTAFLVSSVSDRTKIEPGAFVELCRGVLAGERAEVLRIKGQRAVIDLLGGGGVWHADITDLQTVPRATEEEKRLAV